MKNNEPKLATTLLGWGMPALGMAFLCLSCWFLSGRSEAANIYPKVTYTTTGAVVHQGTAGDPIVWTDTGAWGQTDYTIAADGIVAGSATLSITGTTLGAEFTASSKVFVNTGDANAGLYSVSTATGTLLTLTTTFAATFTGTTGKVYWTPTSNTNLAGHTANLNGKNVSATGTFSATFDSLTQYDSTSTPTASSRVQVTATVGTVTLSGTCLSDVTSASNGLFTLTGTYKFTIGDLTSTGANNTGGIFATTGTTSIAMGNVSISGTALCNVIKASGTAAMTVSCGTITKSGTKSTTFMNPGGEFTFTSGAISITDSGTAATKIIAASNGAAGNAVTVTTGAITIGGTGTGTPVIFTLTNAAQTGSITTGTCTITHTGGAEILAAGVTNLVTFTISGSLAGPASMADGYSIIVYGATGGNVHITGTYNFPSVNPATEEPSGITGILAKTITIDGATTISASGSAIGLSGQNIIAAAVNVTGPCTGLQTYTGTSVISALTVSDASATGVSMIRAGQNFTASNMTISAGSGITTNTFTGNLVSVGAITMTGTSATAITSTATGNTIRSSTITISGDNNTGINAPGLTTTAGSISITSTGSTGIIATGGTAYFGDVRVTGAGSTGVSNLNGTNVGGVIMTTTATAIGVNYTGTSAGSLRAYGVRATAGRPTVTGTLGVEATTIEGTQGSAGNLTPIGSGGL